MQEPLNGCDMMLKNKIGTQTADVNRAKIGDEIGGDEEAQRSGFLDHQVVYFCRIHFILYHACVFYLENK